MTDQEGHQELIDRAVKHGVTDGELEAAAENARGAVADLEEKAASIANELEDAREEVRLLTELLALRRGERDGAPAETAAGHRVPTSTASGEETPSRPSHPVVLEAMRELAAAGQPLHISELMDRLKKRSVAIPGAGNQANLIAHLTRSDDITRPKRGFYALTSFDLPPEPLKPSKRRRVRGPSKAKSKGSK